MLESGGRLSLREGVIRTQFHAAYNPLDSSPGIARSPEGVHDIGKHKTEPSPPI